MKEKKFLYIKNEILIIYNDEMHNIIQLRFMKELILHDDYVDNFIILMFRI